MKKFEKLVEPLLCCLLGICCPPASPQQRAAFKALAAGYGVSDEAADGLFNAALAKRA